MPALDRWSPFMPPHSKKTSRPVLASSTRTPRVLTINGGSSSIRFAVYESAGTLRPLMDGKLERIGSSGTSLTVSDASGKPWVRRVAGGTRRAQEALMSWLESQAIFGSLEAVGHRVVHGMKRSEPERVTPKLLAALHRITPFAPDHLPLELGLIEAFSQRHPELPQVACFDTAFHRSMPLVARQLPIPRRYAARGIERFGFHGLSYAYLMDELARLEPAGARGRVILAHLGGGCSLAAVRDGASLDTSMGFTPVAGLMMGTRTGDLDPGLPYYLARTEGMTPARFQGLVNHESGLLGVSGTSSDLRDLLAREAVDARAAQAIALFCYQVKKWIGAFAAALGGLDILVFSAGVGENSPVIRERICEGLGFLGVVLDGKRNNRNDPVISSDAGRVQVRVLPTDEGRMIARSVVRVLKLGSTRRPRA